jgi:glycosyltransferase involved in cell wall biosynthesis
MSSKKPLVSVIIPNFNYSKYLGQTIESVLSQTYDNFEILVVDDGSTDDSVEVAKQYSSKIRLICQSNGGVSSARNEGILNSRGSFVCFLDADDFWESNKLELQMNLALETKSGLIYSGYLECDEHLSKIREILPVFQGYCEGLYRRKPGSAIALLGTSTALISREVIDLVGIFDTTLSTSADWDYLRRVSKFTDFAFVPSPLVRYRRHGSNMSSGSLAKYYQDNEYAVMKMISEYDNFGLQNSVLNRYSRFRFHLGAGRAFMKIGEFSLGIRHLYKAINGIIGF